MPLIMCNYLVPDPLPLAEDFLVRLLGPENLRTGEAITAGNCLCQIRNAAGVVIAFADVFYRASPLPGGFYAGFRETLFLEAGAVYYVEFLLTTGDGLRGLWRVKRTAAYED